MEKSIERNLGVDLLRIVLMFMIIIHHIMMRGCGLRNLYQNSFDLKNLPFSFINAFLVVAVNCFFLISGYYGMKENLKKEIKLALSVYVMYWLINMAGIISGGQVFTAVQSVFHQTIMQPFPLQVVSHPSIVMKNIDFLIIFKPKIRGKTLFDENSISAVQI